jgi:hypothetical protein
VADHGQLLAALVARVQAGELVGDPVEPLEQGLELPVGDLAAFHRRSVYGCGPC